MEALNPGFHFRGEIRVLGREPAALKDSGSRRELHDVTSGLRNIHFK